ncbi:MAG: potassium channel family protein [Actinobacteria bacterium]|nr:potassium channel family protein [Actinomycetota bacterium]
MDKSPKKTENKGIFLYLGPVIALMLLAVFYALIYKIMVSFNNDTFIGLNQSSHIIDFLYFSVITVTTTGYGDIYPLTKAGKIVNISEVILGIVLLSGTIIHLTFYRFKSNKRQGNNY